MSPARDDIVGLSDYAWRRLRQRMEGLLDAEYLWEPVPDCLTVRPDGEGAFRWDGPQREGDPRAFTTLAWRLTHIAGFLAHDRNGPWLGRPASAVSRTGAPGTAADALAALDRAYSAWSAVLAGTTESLSRPNGRDRGPLRRRHPSFVRAAHRGRAHTPWRRMRAST